MSQDISYILTKQKVEVPKGTVHFVKNNLTVIPLDVSSYHINKYIDLAKEKIKLHAIKLHIEKELEWNDELVYIQKLISDLNLTTFLLEHNSEWADLPVEDFSISFKEGVLSIDCIGNWIANRKTVGFNDEDLQDFILDDYHSFHYCEFQYKEAK